jgi:hypothetical protein
VRHALAFETWRSLAERGGLADREIVELMAALAESALG